MSRLRTDNGRRTDREDRARILESSQKGGNEVDLIGRQGRVGGGVLYEQVSQTVEFVIH